MKSSKVIDSNFAIIEQGNHDGLLNQNGHYAELYNYFRHQSLSYIEQVKEMVAK